MILKDYQTNVLGSFDSFLKALSDSKNDIKDLPEKVRSKLDYVAMTYDDLASEYKGFQDRPRTGTGEMYPRVCIKVPTGGGKTLLAVEAIRRYQEDLKKTRTGLVVWMVHRESIYRQTIEKLSDKSHFYRQLLDQISGGKTLVFEKGDRIRKQDTDENLCILMIMVQSSTNTKEGRKVFQDSGGYTDFFPADNRHDEHEKLIEQIPNLDVIEDSLFSRRIVKTSLGNLIRTQKAFFVVDEMHRMMTPTRMESIDSLNPAFYFGLSATPKERTNILYEVSGRALNDEEMIKLDLHVYPPANNAEWRDVILGVKTKRDALEKKAVKYEQNHGTYIRPIALIQVERTGKDQRGVGFVHAEDVREYLQEDCGVDPSMIAVKSSVIDEIKEEDLLSRDSEVRYIITKDALSEGWDCSFAYILGIIPNTTSNTGLTQLVGRVLRQPYAKKTGVKELDESYVFYSTGETQSTLSKIKTGFEIEGLGDLIAGVQQAGSNGEQMNPPTKVNIRKDIAKNFAHSLYLPQWIIKKEKRKLHYEVDILPRIDWGTLDIKKWVEQELITSIGMLNTVREIVVNIDGESEQGQVIENISEEFDVLFISRRVSDVVPNPFLAYEITEKMTKHFLKKSDQKTLDEHNGYIASEFVRFLKDFKKGEESRIFHELVDDKTIVLSVSSDDGIGYSLPRQDWIVDTGFDMKYEKTLYEKVDSASMNPLEQRVASMLDTNPSVLWWSRNKVDKRGVWYAIQGWQRNKVRPDFVVARKNESEKLEIVYIMETKGEHLVGNADSTYKEKLFTKMNEEVENIEKLSTLSFELNDNFQFEFIKQKDEERHLGRLFAEQED